MSTFPRMHVSLYVSNLAASVNFYSTFFGQPATKVKPGYAKYVLDSPSLIISFIENPERVQANFGHLLVGECLRLLRTLSCMSLHDSSHLGGVKNVRLPQVPSTNTQSTNTQSTNTQVGYRILVESRIYSVDTISQ